LGIPGKGKLSYVEPGEVREVLGGCETDPVNGDLTKRERKKKNNYLCFALRIAASQFITEIAGQILEARGTECGKFLASLVSFWMESCLSREEGD
jgi:hypothetical protein